MVIMQQVRNANQRNVARKANHGPTTTRRVAASQETTVQDVLFARRDDNLMRIDAALGRLAPEQRAALAEVCGGRKSVSAAARSAGVSTAVFKTRVFLALRTLRSTVAQVTPAR
jgi:DNA-directed RNA polymerase specialized sigma24 family protein